MSRYNPFGSGDESTNETAHEQSREKRTRKPKEEKRIEELVVEAFAELGYEREKIKPYENVLTFQRWKDFKRHVKKGEKGVRVGRNYLFHIDQTEEDEPTIEVKTEEVGTDDDSWIDEL